METIFSWKNQESAVFSHSLSNTGGRSSTLLSFPPAFQAALCPQCLSSHLPRPPIQGSYRRGSVATSLKDRKWLMVPPEVRWVGSERRLGERIPDYKSSPDGRVARAGIWEMTMTSARVVLPHFPRQASPSTSVNRCPSFSQRDWKQSCQYETCGDGCESLKGSSTEEFSGRIYQ